MRWPIVVVALYLTMLAVHVAFLLALIAFGRLLPGYT